MVGILSRFLLGQTAYFQVRTVGFREGIIPKKSGELNNGETNPWDRIRKISPNKQIQDMAFSNKKYQKKHRFTERISVD